MTYNVRMKGHWNGLPIRVLYTVTLLYDACTHTHTHTHTEQRDFTPIHRQLTLSGGGHCENIAIVNDSILETDESFTVTITSSDPGVVIAKGNVVLTIQDDDCKC